jgi:type I restriction enzyme M protein
MSESSALVNKLWRYCKVLREDGISTMDYIEQLTFLLFLKMANEREIRAVNPETIVPTNCSWSRLVDADGDEILKIYGEILASLHGQPGVLGTIFLDAKNKISKPARLRRLVIDLINKENWSSSGVDVKGDAYEGLLAKGASDAGKSVGQYFTPRALIAAIVKVMNPQPLDTIHDPACGTGGFLLAAHDYVSRRIDLDLSMRQHLQSGFCSGTELVEETARLAAMNMLLHGIVQPNSSSPIASGRDSLASDDGKRYSMILANPPFGTTAGESDIGSDGEITKYESSVNRDDFWVSTSNKQLNFVQHIKTIMNIYGKAAVVLPDNVLFESGAGETVRRRLLDDFNLHTILRLPTGIFYAGSVKANVLFFDKYPASETPWTKKVWFYDLRTNVHFTQKAKMMQLNHLEDFIECYKVGDFEARTENERFKCFSYEEIIIRPLTNLDIFWLKDDTLEDLFSLDAPDVIARDILENLESVLNEFSAIVEALEEGK